MCVLVYGCGKKLSVDFYTDHQPHVVSVEPADGSMSGSIDFVRVTLSRAIDPESVTENTFLVALTPVAGSADSAELESAIEDGEISTLRGACLVSDDGTEITWVPQDSLSSSHYNVMLTSGIHTADHYPLSQTPGEGNTPFSSRFEILGGESPGIPDTDPQPGVNSSPEGFLVINELFYDSVLPDADGNVFVELFGASGADIGGYTVRFVNGADGKKTGEVILPQGTFIPEDGFFVIADAKTGSPAETNVNNADFIANFDPQNGPDAVLLISPAGEVIDALGYGPLTRSASDTGLGIYESAPAQSAQSGSSLSRVEMRDTGNNSTDFVINISPSPGSSEVTLNRQPGEEAETEEVSPESQDESVLEAPASPVVESDEAGFPYVHFTEIVTDPQRDWNDSAGGNGVPFDIFYGNGTVGSTDEWIEIKNGSTAPVDISGWRIEMNDGTDETEFFSEPYATLVFSAGGSAVNFNADEFVVIGNPRGDLKNAIALRLVDENESLADSVDIENADATSVSAESWQLTTDGGWEIGAATPGF